MLPRCGVSRFSDMPIRQVAASLMNLTLVHVRGVRLLRLISSLKAAEG